MLFMRTIAFALACLTWASGAFAQGKWTKLAVFPEPAEELLGASAGGRMYVFCGLAPGWKPIGMVYEYDPATDKWTKKKPMPLASHHVSFTEYKGKIYAFGGFVLPQSGPAAWVPIDNAWEYDPATDNWKALAPLPTKRGSPVGVTVGEKMDVIGGGTTLPGSSAVHPVGARSLRPGGEHLDGPSQHAGGAPRTRRRRRRQSPAHGERRRAVRWDGRAHAHRLARRLRVEIGRHGALSARWMRFAVAGCVER